MGRCVGSRVVVLREWQQGHGLSLCGVSVKVLRPWSDATVAASIGDDWKEVGGAVQTGVASRRKEKRVETETATLNE
jgi:hypothetical protein